ncbi:hypothetical protein A8H39_01745 [Paraburkholderia fungorum]|uniref:hypothetical protein n=1 Tax=Paraburkholderia fungorum TaxID=134537 RepID=UPI000487F79F|nr:hypothetical protein [Paraburkholderia fungorum]PNE59894.1 hypothetical protein A8H39_01745 [Paraburkholderia fungorum]
MTEHLSSKIDIAISRLTGVGDGLDALGKQDGQRHLMSAVSVLQECRAALTAPPTGFPNKVLSVGEMSAAMDDAKATAAIEGYGDIVPDPVLIRAVEQAVLAKLGRMLAHDMKPVAYLVTGGRMYRDKVFLDRAQADSAVTERRDGAYVDPLGRIGMPGVGSIQPCPIKKEPFAPGGAQTNDPNTRV